MIEGIEIEGFRGISKGLVQGFAKLNVLIGPNNVGKSAVMQAFMLANYRHDFLDWLGARLGLFRGAVRRDAFFAERAKVKFLVPTGGGTETSYVRERTSSHGLLLTSGAVGFSDLIPSARRDSPSYWSDSSYGFLPSDPDFLGTPRRFEDLVSSIIIGGGRGKLIRLLKAMLPNIEDVRILTVGGEPTLYIEERGLPPWPAASAGDGMKRLMGLAAFMALGLSVRFIEEPESHHHPASARVAARLISEGVTDAGQVFVTTHSVALLDELLEAMSLRGHDEEIRVLLLSRQDGVVTSTSLTSSQVATKPSRSKILQALDPRWPG